VFHPEHIIPLEARTSSQYPVSKCKVKQSGFLIYLGKT
jgi:hypothetical protein